jgi:DNA end-binding protein Ku
MSARAIWQGTLTIQKHEIGVKVYSAVLDGQIHFHLLHKRDRTRLEQRMVDAKTQKAVPLHETRHAFEAEPQLYVVVSNDEIERSVPEPSREVRISRFLPAMAIDLQLFDRPYYLGPAADCATDYFALAEALEFRKAVGVASWVMRKRSYVGALIAQQKYLMLITLRHAEDVITVGELDAPQGEPLVPKEKALAEKLIEALSGEFEPEAYHDEYQHRIHELIEAKRAGRKVTPKRSPRRRREGPLANILQASLKGVAARR